MNFTKKYFMTLACMLITSMSFCSSSGTKFPSRHGALGVLLIPKNPIAIGTVSLLNADYGYLTCSVIDETQSQPNKDQAVKVAQALNLFIKTLNESNPFKQALNEGERNIVAIINNNNDVKKYPGFKYSCGIGFR